MRAWYYYEMPLSRQDGSLPVGGRANQKARTRAALLRAAEELVKEGRPPSVPDAADRALVSIATAYRYFSSAEDLWWEASNAAIGETLAEAEKRIDAAGSDPLARLDALIRSTGFRIFDDQVSHRRIAMIALEQWFRQAESPDSERAPIRQGCRNAQIRDVLVPLEDELPSEDIDRLAHALGLVVGAEAVIALTDAVGLDVPTGKTTLLDASRWLLSGALAEMTASDPAS
jgi:AcrR family transcriptional regulator